MVSSYTKDYLDEARRILDELDTNAIDRVLQTLETRGRGGRLFVLGVGSGAGHAWHAVNDFRKIAGLEAYAPTDNVSELTARTTDEGWASVFVEWLKTSRLTDRDMELVFSVGGGDLQRNISPCVVRGVEYAKLIGATVCGIVSRDGGPTVRVADACVVVPTVNGGTVTPHTEAFQAVVWHLLCLASVAASGTDEVGVGR